MPSALTPSRRIARNQTWGRQEEPTNVVELLDDLIATVEATTPTDPVDVVEFVEDELKLVMFPRQKLILKKFYGLPLDAEEEADWEYLRSGQNQYARAWDTGTPGEPYAMLVLIAGRRGSKTMISSAAQSYEIYQLLKLDSPQKHYGLVPRQRISFLNVATAQDQAGIFFDDFKEFVNNSPTLTGATERMLELRIDFRKKIRAECLHSNSRSTRGRTAKMVTFDEFAHFIDTAGPASDEKIYQALTPSIKTFKGDGKILIATSPLATDGVTYDLYKKITEGKIRNALCFQLATWELNPNITRALLDDEFEVDPKYAEIEFGAQFGERQQKYLPNDAIDAMFTDDPLPTLDDIVRERSRMSKEELEDVRSKTYFAHCDPGLRSDKLAFFLVHSEANGDVVVDYSFWRAAAPDGEVDLIEAENHIYEVYKIFKFRKVTFDQWNSAQIIQRLRKRGVRAEEFTFTAQTNMEIYACLRGLITRRKIKSPEIELLEKELKALVRNLTSRGFTVEAPVTGPVRTDDMADALAAACFKATERVGERKRTFLKP
jgi:hypothetical protein